MGICSGFSIPIAQSFGAKDELELRRYVTNSVWLSAVISVILAVVTALGTRTMLQWMNTPAEIIDDAVSYIQLIFAAIPVTVLYNLSGGILRALGDSKTPVYYLVLASLINIVLDLACILYLAHGRGRGGLCHGGFPAVGRAGLRDLHEAALPHPEIQPGGLALPAPVCPPPCQHWRAHGAAIFHYRHWLGGIADCP